MIGTGRELGIIGYDIGKFDAEFGFTGVALDPISVPHRRWVLEPPPDVELNFKADAVRMTFAKWRTIRSFYTVGPGRSGDILLEKGGLTCGLCRWYGGDCTKCDISRTTGSRGCDHTPFDDYWTAVQLRGDARMAGKAALDELRFLRSIFPPTIIIEFDDDWNFVIYVRDGDETNLMHYGERTMTPDLAFRMYYNLRQKGWWVNHLGYAVIIRLKKREG